MSKFSSHPDLAIGASFTVGAEATNVINVAIQLLDRNNGNEVSEAVGLPWYLASDAAGQVIAAAPSGGVAVGSDGLLLEWTANISGFVISEADGDIDLDLTEAGAGTWYLVLVAPDGQLLISGAITFA